MTTGAAHAFSLSFQQVHVGRRFGVALFYAVALFGPAGDILT
jgi:hypothetical protein